MPLRHSARECYNRNVICLSCQFRLSVEKCGFTVLLILSVKEEVQVIYSRSDSDQSVAREDLSGGRKMLDVL